MPQSLNRRSNGKRYFDLIFGFVMMAPFIGFGILVLYFTIPTLIKPKPLQPVYATSQEHIEDRLGVMEDPGDLEKTLQEFEDMTGIAPYIITVSETESNDYANLEKYAYTAYVDRFQDEQHWLIVYMEEKPQEDGFVNWDWAAVQGKETDQILTSEHVEIFNEDLQRYLTMDYFSTDKAFQQAFSQSLKYMMGTGELDENTKFILGFMVVWFGFIIFCGATLIRNFINS